MQEIIYTYFYIAIAIVWAAFFAAWLAQVIEEQVRAWNNRRALRRRTDDEPFSI